MTKVGETVQVTPRVPSRTVVSPSPAPKPKPEPPAPPSGMLPSHVSQYTSAFIWLYLAQTWVEELMFQLTLKSKLSRVSFTGPVAV